MASLFGRKVVVYKTNKSGGGVIAGDVVIIDTANDNAFTTTTSAGFTGRVGIADETIASNGTGRIVVEGHVPLVNVNASVTRGHFGTTHIVAKQATDAGASRTIGTFCQFTTGGTTPEADIYAPDLNAASGSVASDPIWDAAGDLAVGTGADTAAKLAKGSAGQLLRVKGDGSTLEWGGLLATIVGYNTAGGSFKNMNGSYAKKVTIAASALVLNIAAYVKGNATNAAGLGCAILSDSAGTPLNVIAKGVGNFDGTNAVFNQFRNTTARWMEMPINAYLPAGDYWIVAHGGNGTGGIQLGYDAATPVDWTNASQYPGDQSLTAFVAHATDKHSIRALTVPMSL